MSHANSYKVNLTCLDPFKRKKKFVWVVVGGWVVKTKNRVRLRSISDLSDLDLDLSSTIYDCYKYKCPKRPLVYDPKHVQTGSQNSLLVNSKKKLSYLIFKDVP